MIRDTGELWGLVRYEAEELFKYARKQFPKYAFRPSETFRPNARQLKLYNDRRSYVKSFGAHYFRFAFDIAFGKGKGERIYRLDDIFTGKKSDVGDKVFTVLSDYWLRRQKTTTFYYDWGGNWKSFIDKPHFAIYPVGKRGRDSIKDGLKRLDKDVITELKDIDVRDLSEFDDWRGVLE